MGTARWMPGRTRTGHMPGWGRRLHRLDPDPVTAPYVRWIFATRPAGDRTAGIARTLNHLGVPSPAAYDVFSRAVQALADAPIDCPGDWKHAASGGRPVASIG